MKLVEPEVSVVIVEDNIEMQKYLISIISDFFDDIFVSGCADSTASR